MLEIYRQVRKKSPEMHEKNSTIAFEVLYEKNLKSPVKLDEESSIALRER
jgi:hypothetical protein